MSAAFSAAWHAKAHDGTPAASPLMGPTVPFPAHPRVTSNSFDSSSESTPSSSVVANPGKIARTRSPEVTTGPGAPVLRQLGSSSPNMGSSAAASSGTPLSFAQNLGPSQATTATTTTTTNNGGNTTWKRALYERQPFDDNYVDKEAFLSEMRKNANVHEYDYFDIVKDTFSITQNMSITVIFVNVFAGVLARKMSLLGLMAIDFLTLGGSLAVYIALKAAANARGNGSPSDQLNHWSKTNTPFWNAKPRHAGSMAALVDSLRQLFVLTAAVLLLAPTFRTLTRSYADDTIWALSITCMSLHFVFTDYNYLNGGGTAFTPQSVPVIAALFACVLMASRIQSTLHASALVGFGTICFALSPLVRHRLRKVSFTGHVAATSLLCGVAFGALIPVPLLAAIYAAVTMLIVFVVPWAFVAMQSRFKFQINGPWDEAKPKTSTSAEWENAGLLK